MKKEFKVLLIGDYNVGKTTFIHKCEPVHKCTHIAGVELRVLEFDTSIGIIMISVYIPESIDVLNNLDSKFMSDVDAAMLMFAHNDKKSFDKIPVLYRDVRRAKKDVFVTLIGNKYDLPGVIENSYIRLFTNIIGCHYSITYMEDIHHKEPFLHMIRSFSSNESICFIEAPSTHVADFHSEVGTNDKGLTTLSIEATFSNKADLCTHLRSFIDKMENLL